MSRGCYIVILVVVLVLGASVHRGVSAQGDPEDSNDPTKFHARFYDTRPNRVRVILGDRPFDLPANYLVDPTPPNIQEDGILMIAMWPGFEPRTKENMDEMYKTPGFGRRINILVTALGSLDNVHVPKDYEGARKRLKDVDHRFNPPFNIRPKISENPKYQYKGVVYGLDKWELKDRDLTYGYGSDKHDIMGPAGENPKTVYLGCAAAWAPPEGEYFSPGCDMDFITNGLWINASFHKKYLPDWQNIRQSLTKMLDEAFVHAQRSQQKPL